MQTTEVTQSQWEAVMRFNPCYFKYCDDCPMEQVSWENVQEFIRKLNQHEEENKYRLPTEAEWEYACRAGSTTRFCYGDDDERLSEYAWYKFNSWGNLNKSYLRKTHPVAQKKPNAWGLYGMHGNVMEWCQDFYGDYPAGSVTDPKGPEKGDMLRVVRGGAYSHVPNACRSAKRKRLMPGYRRDVGFRIVWMR